MSATILIAAGGTGGHIYPGVAVADELKRRDPGTRVVFVGTPKGLESRLVPRAGYELEMLPILPLNGVGFARMSKGLLALPKAMWRAFALLTTLRPAAVLGVGGYAGGPLVLMAALRGIPTVILEPNAHPGFTNKVLKMFARHAACSYESTRQYFGAKGVVTGNPVRGGFATLPPKALAPPFSLLIFGGSQGSKILNEAVLKALPLLPEPNRLRIVHQTGEAMRDAVATQYMHAGRPDEVVAFLDDMERRFAEADLILARSGATTCAELAAAGKAAVLVPFALAADDHQRSNALAFEGVGAALMIEEKDLTGERLASALSEILETPGRLPRMADASRSLGKADAAARVADLLLPPTTGGPRA